MAKITQITIQTKNKNRANLYLDEEFFCGLELETVVKNGLSVNQEINKNTLQKIIEESEAQVAFTKALNLLSKQLKTTKQLKEYLAKKDYSDSVIKKVIEKLLEYKYLDDYTFAKNYIEYHFTTKGVLRLNQELLQKGIKREIIQEFLKELPPQEEQIASLKNKYLKNKPKDKNTYAKLYAYLTRRGFTYEQIRPFIDFKEE